jgi:hypothetical protein
MTDWKAYPRNRKILNKDGYAIIIPDSFKEKANMPLFCEVCQISFCNKEDEKTYKLFKCCTSCADIWAYSNKEEWLKGWRPEADKIKSAVEKRLFTNPNIVFE